MDVKLNESRMVELQQMNKNNDLVSDHSDDSSDDGTPHVHDNMNDAENKSPKAYEKLANDRTSVDSSQYFEEPQMQKQKTSAKLMPDEEIKLSKKYEKYLTIDNDEIVDRNDKIDALILQLKLPHIYTLAEDEQWAIIQEKYSWIDDDDGEVDRFQYEEIQEVVAHMTSIERRYIYDTIEEYDEDYSQIKQKYRMIPCELQTMNVFKKKKVGTVCCGCGVELKFDKKKKKMKKISKAWRGYLCEETQREFIFHSRLCVKLRKAKEWIRDAVYQHNTNVSRMQIDFLKNENLESAFQPSTFFTTFDETQKKKVAYTRHIRKYYQECVNTDLRGYDIDQGDRFSNIPIEIKYLDQREFAIPMFKYLIREVQIKEFDLFWEFIQFFISYIDTPKLINLLKQHYDVLFALHDDTGTNLSQDGQRELVDFLTIICEGALYPIATCLYISAFLKEHGETFWNEQETESLSKHFRNMASTIIDEIESEHLVAIILETPTNIYDDDDDSAGGGLSTIDIAIKYKMLHFLENHRISRISLSLWYERKIIHPKKRFGQELSFYDLFQRLSKTPAKFYFSPAGLNIVRLGLYIAYLGLFSYVTYGRRYNYADDSGDANQFTYGKRDSENLLWLFNIAAILYEFYRCCVSPRAYFSIVANVNEFVKAIIWIILFFLKFVYYAPVPDEPCIYVIESESAFPVNCGFNIIENAAVGNASFAVECVKYVTRKDPYICTDTLMHNRPRVELYMAFWAIQCILFWITPVFYLQRNRSAGPLLKMIGLMFGDMFNILMLILVFQISITLCIFYLVSTDLNINEEDGGELDFNRLEGTVSACGWYAMLSLLGQHDWDAVSSTSQLIGYSRSIFLEGVVALGSVIGTILLLNLLIAMLSTRFGEVSKLSVLEVNYTRICQSYAASREVSLIPPPLNYFAFALMAIWFLIDLLITACTARTKMLNDWFFTPLNRTTFSAGDFINYRIKNKELQPFVGGRMRGMTLKNIGRNRSKTMGGLYSMHSGFVQHAYTSEVAQIQVGNDEIYVHKSDIIKIKKDVLTERLSDADANGICASITSSGRYYCKYCRYFFHGDQVGNVEQLSKLFEYYGIKLDDDDTGKLSNMLGEEHKKNKKKRRRQRDKEREKENESIDENKYLRTLGVAQLCPECYRPFYCSADHYDEMQRLQYLSEVCSFWVFMILLYVPLVAAFCIPALFSYIFQIVIGHESILGAKDKAEKEQSRLSKKIKTSQNNDTYRAFVVDNFDEHRPLNDYVELITKRLNYLHKKIRESVADDEEDNIVRATQDKMQLKKLELTPKEAKYRMTKLKKMHHSWLQKLDILIEKVLKMNEQKKAKRKFKQENDSLYSPVSP